MSGTPVEIHWFPRHTDRFLTWGSEINLYQVKNSDDVDHRVSTSASLKFPIESIHSIKSFRLLIEFATFQTFIWIFHQQRQPHY